MKCVHDRCRVDPPCDLMCPFTKDGHFASWVVPVPWNKPLEDYAQLVRDQAQAALKSRMGA